jgi:hypothetical protein
LIVPSKSDLANALQVEYTKLRFIQQPLIHNMEAIPGFSIQALQFDSICQLVAKLEDYLGRKLKILEIGSAQGFFGLQLAEKGHKVVSIEWEEENIQFIKNLRRSFPNPVPFEIFKIDVDRISELNEIEFDLSISMGSLVQVYRTLNLTSQKTFFDFVENNSKLAIWDIPVFEENASWNWAIKLDPLEDFIYSPFLYELGRFRRHIRGSKWPLIVTSKNFAYTGKSIFKFESSQVHFEHPFSEGKQLNRRTINLGRKILKIELHSITKKSAPVVFEEFNFLEDKRIKENNAIGFPKVISTNYGEYVSQFSRESVEGMRLDLALNLQNRTEIRKSLVSMTAELALSGVFPNDLRPWNVMWDGSACRPIDFASSGFVDRDESGIPQFMSFLATIDFIKSGNPSTENWNLQPYILSFNKIYSSLGHIRHLLFDFTWKELFSDKTFVEKISELIPADAIQEVIQVLKNRVPDYGATYDK